MVINVDIDGEDKLKMLGPDQMPAINVGKWDISKGIVSMMEINP